MNYFYRARKKQQQECRLKTIFHEPIAAVPNF